MTITATGYNFMEYSDKWQADVWRWRGGEGRKNMA